MPTLRNLETRSGLMKRLQRLTPETKPQWGKLDAPRLLCRLSDTFGMSLGTLLVPSHNIKTFQRFPFKQLFLYVVPFPKGANAPDELLKTPPDDFESDRKRLFDRIDRLASTPSALGPEHPFFGPLTNDEWNVLQGKHLRHHLKQFGL
ncbi:MAG: DUF1569 domain-containing protein [Terracidiphilus sp.]